MKKMVQFDFEFTTSKTKKEIINLIDKNTEISNYVEPKILTSSDKIFTGIINASSFKLAPIVNYRSTFLPLLYGEIFESEDDTLVRIQTEITSITRAILIIFNIICLLFIVLGLLIWKFGNIPLKNLLFIIFLPVLLSVTICLLFLGAANDARDAFLRIFEE